jgi:23S rRNA (uracil-5-)-methyltransferase RumA
MVCEHFGKCGGCAYLDMVYEDELAMKENGVRELLAPFEIPRWEGIIPAPNVTGYRNKMEFAFGDAYKDGPLALGIRKKRNFYEVAIPNQCVLIPDEFKNILQAVLQIGRDSGETFYHRKRHTGTLRHLVLRHGEFTGELLVNLVTASASKLDITPIADIKNVAGLLHTINDGVADVVNSENARVLAGRGYYKEKINGLDFNVGAFSFFQTNSAGAQVLYEKIIEYAAGGNNAYDLYCGTGTIALLLSKKFAHVIGMELNNEAVRAAKENAMLNGINNCDFFAGDVLEIMDSIINTPDLIVVDPPRDGLHPKALPKIAKLGAERLVYVSCKPSSLARDLALLVEYGYTAQKAVCVDMFPRTPHVETVVLLQLK